MKICGFCGTHNKNCCRFNGKGELLCPRHYNQMRVGTDLSLLNVYDRNTIRIVDDYCEMEIRDKNQNVVAVTKFSKKHYDRVSKVKWGLNCKNGYIRNRDQGCLHVFIYGRENGKQVDHINGDILDNRDENLRAATPSQNTLNTRVYKSNTSGVKGVNWNKELEKWVVRVSVDGKRISAGYYDCLETAKKKRTALEREYYKEFRRV